jgi:hypothetical protein
MVPDVKSFVVFAVVIAEIDHCTSPKLENIGAVFAAIVI